MPKRVVDGDALWRSKKLKQVRPEFRAEYANLIPLAEANGVFDADPERVWSDVYSFNRSEISTKIVVKILDEFEKFGLLHRWEADGKVWGYWNGIEKPGRLPAKSLVERGDFHLTTPSAPHVEDLVTTSDHKPSIGLGLGISKGLGSGKASRARKDIPGLCRSILGLKPEPWPNVLKELKDLIEAHGANEVTDAFTEWATAKRGVITANPLQEFFKVADGILRGVIEVKENPALVDLEAKLYTLGDQPFAGESHQKLGGLLKEYPAEELTAAYGEFVSGRDDFDMKRAPKEFCSAAPAIIKARRDRAENEQHTRELYERTSERRRVEVDADFARLEREQEIGDQDLKETFGII